MTPVHYIQRHLIFILAAALLWALPACSPPPEQSEPDASELLDSESPGEGDGLLSQQDQEQFEELLAELTDSPFGSVAVVSFALDDQAMTLAKGVQFDGGEAIDDSTYFNIASVSKSLTAARIVSLAHEGQLELDDSVEHHLPDLRLMSPGGEDVTADISLVDLLRHESGLPHQPGEQLDESVFDNQWDDPELIQKITADWEIELAAAPGSYHYSNLGYVLLAAVIENTASCRFATCMETYMGSLGFERMSLTAGAIAGEAAHGRVIQDGEPQFLHPTWFASVYALAFGGAWSSMPDLVEFGTVLASAAEDEELPLSEMAAPIGADSYGLGIVHGDHDGLASLEHDGATAGFYARLIVLPDVDITLAVATNGGMESAQEIQRFTEITDEMLAILTRQ